MAEAHSNRGLTPNDAVLLRIQTLEGHVRMNAEVTVPFDVQAMADSELQMLEVAHLYTWRPDLLTASIAAAESLPPPVTLSPDLMPTASGIYLFDVPVPFSGVAQPLRGLGWNPFDGEHFTAIFAYCDATPAQPVRGPLQTKANFLLQNGADVLDATARGDRRMLQPESEFNKKDGSESIVRFMVASWLWLKQRIMDPEQVPVASMVTKQATRAHVDSSIYVIVLRRTQPSAHDPEHRSVEWGCQWLVRGHWRQQFYPSAKQHRPVWIEPHVKGPSDKPLKPPTETVFKVVR